VAAGLLCLLLLLQLLLLDGSQLHQPLREPGYGWLQEADAAAT
jgi:hypothetical protein